MTSFTKGRLIWLLAATALAALAMGALLPTKWVPRTGLGWEVEHFLTYFVATGVLCVAWRRPYVVAVSLILFAGLLEAMQGLTPDRMPNFTAAFAGAAGAFSAAMLFAFLLRARNLAPFDVGRTN